MTQTQVAKDQDTFPGTTILVARVKAKHVDVAIEKLGVEVPKKASLGERVKALAAWFRENTAKTEMAKCDECLGVSDLGYEPACPYCNEDDDAEPADEAEEAQADAPEEAPEPTEPPQDSGTEIVDPDAVLENAAELQEGEAPKPEKKRRGRPPKAKPAPSVNGANGHANGANGTTGLAKAAKQALGKAHDAEVLPAKKDAEKALDRQLTALKKAVVDQHASIYTLGVALKSIFDDHLWKARTNDDGSIKYKTWEGFCKTELGVEYSGGYTMGLMKVVEKYDEEIVRRLGPGKLFEIVKAPTPLQPKMFKMAEAGATIREISKVVKDHNASKPASEKTRHDKAHETRRDPAGKSSEKVTVAALVGKKHSVKVYKRKSLARGQEPQLCKRLADGPVAYLDLVNDVRLFVSLAETASGELRAIFEFKRHEAEE